MQAVKQGTKHIPMAMIMIDIMERFHWTYEEYLNTPPALIDLIIEKSNIDHKLRN